MKNNAKKHVCIVTEYFPLSPDEGVKGGVEARAYNIAKRLAKEYEKKYDISVITSWRKGEKRTDFFDGINVIRAGPNHSYSHKGAVISRLGFAFSAYRAIKKLNKTKKISLVDGYNFVSYIPANLGAKSIGAKKIATYHEVWIGEWKKNKGFVTGFLGNIWERTSLKLKWDKVIAVSEFTRKKLEAQGIKNVEVIPNGVDIENFTKSLEGTSKSEEPVITYVGRLTPQKRVEDLIRAVEKIKKEFPGIKCKIIGTGDEREKLEKLSEELELKEYIEFLGFVKNYEDVKKEIKKSRVFCLPSILEGFGMVIIESMACSTPYVCSDIDVLKEITANGQGGLLFKQQDPESLAEKLRLLLKDNELYNKKIEECRKFVEKYDWNGIVKMTERVYNKLLE